VTLASLSVTVVPFAAPSYAAKVRRGAKLADVAWIGWAPPLDHLPPNPQLARQIPGFRPVFSSDDYLVQLRACEAGIGAMFLARVAHRFSREDLFVELDVDFPPFPSGIHLVAARSALAIPRVRAVADRLAAELAAANTNPARRAAAPKKGAGKSGRG
jgi:DNA-binding transcriptional LysR family regulator